MASLDALHRARVSSLYRRALRTAYDWCGSRATFRPYALDIRARFDANRAVDSVKHRNGLLEAGEQELVKLAHPDPYRFPTSPGGVLWERFGIPSRSKYAMERIDD